MKEMKRFFVVLAGIVCFSGICLSDTNKTLVLGPNNNASWDDCVLKPYETANLTIETAPPPPGYLPAEVKPPVITKSSANFCWAGGGLFFSVVNSAGVSASTRVVVNGEWHPIPGGGPGTPPPILYGSAAGTAVAKPTNYWNEADTPEMVVGGDSVTVNAYKDDGADAPSTWSILSGPATIVGAGASAEVMGTNMSANNFDVKVHSVCDDEPGLEDDEMMTVVGVKSIKANPEIVEVGKSVSFEIKTQPEGYNYMVSYTPPDFNVPGSNDVVATCGTSAATCSVVVVKVEFVHLSSAPQWGVPGTRFENDIASGPIEINGLVRVTPEDQVDKVSLKLAHNIKTLRQRARADSTTNMFQRSTGGAWVKDGDSTLNTILKGQGIIEIVGTDEPAQSYWTGGPFSHPLHIVENHKNFLQYQLLSYGWKTLGVVEWGWTADVYKNGETITTSGTIEGGMGYESKETPITSPNIQSIPETSIPPIN